MKFEAQKSVVEAVFSKAASVLATKDLLPILKNFFVTVTAEGKLCVVSTDLELSIIANATVFCLEEGSSLFPGRKLLEIIKSCEDDIVTIAVVADVAIISCAGATWDINLMSAEDYPKVIDVKDDILYDTEINRIMFVEALLKVKGAAAKEGVRPALQMVDIAKGHARASDGAIFRQISVPGLENMDMQIQVWAVDTLVKFLRGSLGEYIGVSQTENHLLFVSSGDAFIISKTIVKYPDVDTILLEPARSNRVGVTVDRHQLIDGIRRVRINADGDIKGVIFVLRPNSLDLRAHDKYGNMATQTLEVEYTAAERAFAVNHENIIDALQAIDSSVVTIMLGVDTKTKKSPLLISDNGTIAVLQQIKLPS